jgi:hypothetical protein
MILTGSFRVPGAFEFTMVKTITLSVLFFCSLGLLFAAYASVPV